jgi:hypothetical protein
MSVLTICAIAASSGRSAEAVTPAPTDAKPIDVKAGPKLECLKPAETGEEVRSRHFLEAYVVLRTAAREAKAEALSAKLCRLGDDWVYSIALLHRDGRFVHMLLDATTGRVLPPHGHEPPKT